MLTAFPVFPSSTSGAVEATAWTNTLKCPLVEPSASTAEMDVTFVSFPHAGGERKGYLHYAHFRKAKTTCNMDTNAKFLSWHIDHTPPSNYSAPLQNWSMFSLASPASHITVTQCHLLTQVHRTRHTHSSNGMTQSYSSSLLLVNDIELQRSHYLPRENVKTQ